MESGLTPSGTNAPLPAGRLIGRSGPTGPGRGPGIRPPSARLTGSSLPHASRKPIGSRGIVRSASPPRSRPDRSTHPGQTHLIMTGRSTRPQVTFGRPGPPDSTPRPTAPPRAEGDHCPRAAASARSPRTGRDAPAAGSQETGVGGDSDRPFAPDPRLSIAGRPRFAPPGDARRAVGAPAIRWRGAIPLSFRESFEPMGRRSPTTRPLNRRPHSIIPAIRPDSGGFLSALGTLNATLGTAILTNSRHGTTPRE